MQLFNNHEIQQHITDIKNRFDEKVWQGSKQTMIRFSVLTTSYVRLKKSLHWCRKGQTGKLQEKTLIYSWRRSIELKVSSVITNRPPKNVRAHQPSDKAAPYTDNPFRSHPRHVAHHATLNEQFRSVLIFPCSLSELHFKNARNLIYGREQQRQKFVFHAAPTQTKPMIYRHQTQLCRRWAHKSCAVLFKFSYRARVFV